MKAKRESLIRSRKEKNALRKERMQSAAKGGPESRKQEGGGKERLESGSLRFNERERLRTIAESWALSEKTK